MLALATFITLFGVLPHLTLCALDTWPDNSVLITGVGDKPPSILWGAKPFAIVNELRVRPPSDDRSLELWEYLDNDEVNSWKPFGDKAKGNFTLLFPDGQDQRPVSCYIGRFTNTFRADNHPSFRFSTGPGYLDHCFKDKSGDEVYIACGEPEGEIKADCHDWPADGEGTLGEATR